MTRTTNRSYQQQDSFTHRYVHDVCMRIQVRYLVPVLHNTSHSYRPVLPVFSTRQYINLHFSSGILYTPGRTVLPGTRVQGIIRRQTSFGAGCSRFMYKSHLRWKGANVNNMHSKMGNNKSRSHKVLPLIFGFDPSLDNK